MEVQVWALTEVATKNNIKAILGINNNEKLRRVFLFAEGIDNDGVKKPSLGNL